MHARDKDYYLLTVSIGKALSPLEAPLKTKHARAAIICTHKTHGAQSFWAVILRQPLMENRFIAWKFCHLLHKVLREGHPKCMQDSQRHKKMMLEVGKLWGHLKDGFGICVQYYTKLLVNKLIFHERNPRLPGNLVFSFTELERVSGNDINFYFQLGVEIFDYLDEILELQIKIFQSINSYRMSSMTPQGQCRLAPLIPLIQDSNQLYDFAVRLMFKLHSHLPNDLLSGHRERFRTMFGQLKTFYDNVRPLQYFADLIQVPKLPESAPNFNSKIDFGSYIPPVVVIPEPEPDPIVDNLVDMSIPDNIPVTPEPTTPDHSNATVTINFDRLLQERDNLIRELQIEIEHLRKTIKMIQIEHRDEIMNMEEQISKLNSQLQDCKEEQTQIRLKKEELELKAQIAPTLEQKAIAEEERAKASEEKFQKLKTMYTQIRDEHVKLLRQHGEATKQLTTIKKETNDLTTEKELLKVQLEEFHQKQYEIEESVHQNIEAERKEKELNHKYDKLNDNYEKLKLKYDDLQADKSAEIAELRVKIDYVENENKIKNLENTNELEKLKLELNSRNDELIKLEESSKILMIQRDCEIDELKQKIEQNEEKFQTTNATLERLSNEKHEIENDLQDLLHQQNELDEKHRNALQTISALESSLQDSKIHGETSLRTLLEACIKSSENLAMRAANENEFSQAAGTSAYFMMIAEELQEKFNELKIVYDKYSNDNSQVEGLARKTVLAGHLMATVQIQGMTICNTSADIECGERIANELKNFNKDVISLFAALQQTPSDAENKLVDSKIENLKDDLTKITSMIHDLTSKTDNSVGQIGDQIETELASMDKAIEEAAAKIVEMLSKSRASDSGVKLEVNEKILDSCTNLMQCIRILVQKSRFLQAEIVSLGKGTASVKEFYKRNHQWTEGLISAAKSVAQGANLLLTAANKAVSGEAKHHLDLIVAAQEIAACTAQLVVASRVKAPRGSQNLNALSTASKNVTQATGTVVATAKDCSQQLEDSQDLDLSKLTVHQAKTLEMEIQVKVLELEQSLQMERLRLAAFRRKNYQNSE